VDDFDYEDEGLEEEVEQPVSRSSDTFNDIADRMRNSKTGKKVEGKVKETAKSAKDKVMNSEAGKAAKSGIKNALNNTKYGKALTKAAEVGKKAKEGTDKVKDGIEKAKQIKDQVVEKVREKAIETAVNSVAPGLGKIAAKLDKMATALKKKADEKVKEITGIDPKKARRTIFIAILLLPFCLFFLLTITAGAMFLSSEDNFTDLNTIIKKREAKYGKPLIRMNGDGDGFFGNYMTDDFSKILMYDEKRDGTPEEKDVSVKTYLSEMTNKEYDDYLPMENEESKPEYQMKLEQVRKFLLAGRKNFNAIKWSLVKDNSGTTYNVDMKFAVNDLLDWATNSNKEKSLYIPDPGKYKISENSTQEDMVKTYLNLTNLYLQHWVVPHSLNIASQDAAFGLDVLNNMQSPIEVSLYELSRLIKTTTTDYYLKTKVTWKNYKYDGTNYNYDPSSSNETGYDSNTSVRWKDLKSGNGTWQLQGENALVGQYFDNDNLIAKNQFNSNDGSYFTEYYVELQKDALGEYIKDGVKKNYTPTKTKKPYRTIPNVTYAEGIYNIIKASYKIKSIDESESPITKNIDLQANGKETITEVWDETLTDDVKEIKKYKLSYYDPSKDYDTDENGPNKVPISRIEWFMDSGAGNFKDNMYPKKSDPKVIENLKTKFKFPTGTTTIDEQAILDATELKYYTRPKLDLASKLALFLAGEDCVQGYSYDDLDFGYQQIKKYYDYLEEQFVAEQGSLGSINLGDIPQDGFAWPVDLNQSPNSDKVNYIFGYTNAYASGANKHNGIDISHGGMTTVSGGLTKGPNIIATHDGTVTSYFRNTITSNGRIGYSPKEGNCVEIKTEDGKFTTQYMHLSYVTVKPGDKVSRGQVIGTMGTTGNSDGAHLHYVIKDSSGTNVDPLLYYVTEPAYGSYTPRELTPFQTYRYVGSISSGLSNTGGGGFLGFLGRAEGTGPMVGNKYKAYDDGYGFITIGMGVTWKDHVAQFNAAGITNMSVGTLVDKSIVDAIKNQDIASRVANIKALLEKNGITDLKQYQIDALTSYHYNVGNINKFPAAYKTYGVSEGLWTAFFSKPVTSRGEVAPGLIKRRAAEWELFTTGNYNYDK
jgi:murein DD-endopeptidase MepM/ murein hydrolase activator NlpD/GH24 family phage-related lysozyme (muramidase)